MADRSRSRSPLRATPLTEADLITQNGNLRRQIERFETENEGLKAELHSRKYFKVEALPETARAALDVVCKHDADLRVDSQRQTIVAHAQRITDLKARVKILEDEDRVDWSEMHEHFEGRIARRDLEIARLLRGIEQRRIYQSASQREDWMKIIRQGMEITDLKQHVEHLEVELAGCSKCKGSASGTYGRLCEDCYFEEHPSEEESS